MESGKDRVWEGGSSVRHSHINMEVPFSAGELIFFF